MHIQHSSYNESSLINQDINTAEPPRRGASNLRKPPTHHDEEPTTPPHAAARATFICFENRLSATETGR